jgi:hypothetical protein
MRKFVNCVSPQLEAKLDGPRDRTAAKLAWMDTAWAGLQNAPSSHGKKKSFHIYVAIPNRCTTGVKENASDSCKSAYQNQFNLLKPSGNYTYHQV